MDTIRHQSYQSLVRASLLFAASYAFAVSVIITVHELGHALLLRYFGVSDVNIELHPFRGARTLWDATDAFIGVVDMAGLLFAVITGTIITAGLWRWRKPVFLPFLLTGAVAYLTEGISNFMQIAMQIPGSDALRIVQSGVPGIMIAVVAVAAFVIGLVLLLLLLPLVGLTPDSPFLNCYIIIAIGTATILLVGVVYGLVTNDSAVLSRNFPQFILALILSAGIAAVYKPAYPWVSLLSFTEPASVTWRDSIIAVLLAVVAITIQLLYFA